MKFNFLKNLFLCALLLATVSVYAQKKPNIVFILSDDAGYADFGFQSDRFIKTPNIDRIANEGVKFTNAYVTAAVCAPSRGGLLTGINQAEFGNVGNFIRGVKYTIPQDSYGIPKNIKLIGDYLHPLGYKNALIGKWHEGFSKPYHPNTRGFDYFWGFLWGSSNYNPGTAQEVEENGKAIDVNSIPYMTDAIGNQAIQFIEEQKENPFFIFVSFNAVHTPLHAKKEDIDKFDAQFSDKVRMKNAAMTHSLDENVGRIIAHLEKLNLLDNTILIFSNDNGGQKTTLHADNYPLRGMKGDIYEGGIRVPMAVRWPSKIKSGTVSNEIVSSLDILPTILAAAGQKSKSNPQLKGMDLVQVANIKKGKTPAERELYWYLGKQKGALRKGDWKLIVLGDAQPQLYNLKTDIGETKDVYSTQTAIAKNMLQTYRKWEESLPPANFAPLKAAERDAD